MLDLVEVVLRADALEFARLDGSVPQQVRIASMDTLVGLAREVIQLRQYISWDLPSRSFSCGSI